MGLAFHQPIGFIPTQKPDEARFFYENTLGLCFESDDQFALVFRLGPANATMLRVVRAGQFTPAPYTIFGWQVDDLNQCVADLKGKGVTFLRYSFLDQDEHGIWHAPGGAKVVWFQDPDGNTLSLSCHPF